MSPSDKSQEGSTAISTRSANGHDFLKLVSGIPLPFNPEKETFTYSNGSNVDVSSSPETVTSMELFSRI